MTEDADLRSLPTPTALLMVALRRFAGRTAFAGERPVTYAELGDVIGRLQSVLAQAGAAEGGTVAILSRNRWEAWAAAAASSALGLAPCWLHPLATAATHAEQAGQVAPSAIVIDAAAFPDRVEILGASLPGVPIFTLGGSPSSSDLFLAAQKVGSVSLRDLSKPSGLGMVGLTGGTTGKSKAVERSMASVASMSIATLSSFEIPDAPNFLAMGPISHVTGVKILPSLLRGGRVSMVDRFDPAEILAIIERERISLTLAVPTMIYDLLDSAELATVDTSSLRLLLYGGAAMSPARLAEGITRIGPVFSQLYGQAECHPIAVLETADHDPARPEVLAACGFPVKGCEVRIFGEGMNEVAPGEIGEICVRGPGVMMRYRDAPDATAEALAGGWLHTGDLGRLDEVGRIYIVDRKKDMIVTGGFNVYPREVEDVLTSHPDIAAAAVIGLPDPRWGEAVHAVVVMRPGRRLDEEELCARVRRAKGSLLTPKGVFEVSELPKTAAGKVDKLALAVRFGSKDSQEKAPAIAP
ncbi:AMP-binding protein [Novosphingobium sp. PS1R-30]|uniref:AMP-binding protein n=1 Tax=Novosphingobium anseongense TaxID=3133436 RepID=A0ABU8S1L3_9SPHN